MLIIVPASETKRPPAASGAPVDLDRLSFPELAPTRRRVVDALIRTSADLDAFERLRVRLTMAAEVARNTHLLELPAVPVLDLYTGPVHEGLDAARLSPAASARADRSMVIASPLWGLLRPTDRIPPYRLDLTARLIGVCRPDHVWREVLPGVLADAAGPEGVIVDLRSPASQSAGMPAGLGDRTVHVRIDHGPPGNRIGEVISKRARGASGHHLLESGANPVDVPALADVLGDRWGVRLASPERPGRPWTLTLSLD